MHENIKKNINITIEIAKLKDSLFLWNLRNELTGRLMLRNSEYTSWSEHSEWIKNALNNEDKFLYIAKEKNSKISLIKFERFNEDKDYEISINLHSSRRNIGLGKIILNLAIKRFWEDSKDCQKIIATIKEINISSKKIFLANGFRYLSRQKNYEKYYLSRIDT